MNKAQTVTATYIEDFLDQGGKSFNWDDLMNSVKASNVKVKNWMTVRSILQAYISEGFIKRSDNLHNEDYLNNQ